MSTSPNKKTILVIGATGAQGRAVIKSLLERGDGGASPYQVRALTRNPSSTRAKQGQGQGIDFVRGSFVDLDAVGTALQGCYGVFINTDGFTVGEKLEMWSAMRIIELAHRHRVKHLVWSSLDYLLQLGSWDAHYDCHHYNGKARVSRFLSTFPSAENGDGLTWSEMLTGPYTEALASQLWNPIIKDGGKRVIFELPLGDSGVVPWVSLPDIAKFARWIFDHRSEASAQSYEVASDPAGGQAIADAFNRAQERLGTGIVAEYRPAPDFDAWFTKDRLPLADMQLAPNSLDGTNGITFRDNFRPFFKAYNDAAVTRDMEKVKMVIPQPRTIEQYTFETKWDGSLQKDVIRLQEEAVGRVIKHYISKTMSILGLSK